MNPNRNGAAGNWNNRRPSQSYQQSSAIAIPERNDPIPEQNTAHIELYRRSMENMDRRISQSESRRARGASARGGAQHQQGPHRVFCPYPIEPSRPPQDGTEITYYSYHHIPPSLALMNAQSQEERARQRQTGGASCRHCLHYETDSCSGGEDKDAASDEDSDDESDDNNNDDDIPFQLDLDG